MPSDICEFYFFNMLHVGFAKTGSLQLARQFLNYTILFFVTNGITAGLWNVHMLNPQRHQLHPSIRARPPEDHCQLPSQETDYFLFEPSK